MQATLSLLHGMNSFLDCFQVTTIPFVCAFDPLKLLLSDARTLKYFMHLLVIEGEYHTVAHEDGNLSMQQLIGYTCCLSILSDAFVGSFLQCLIVVKQVRAVVFVKCRLTNLQTVAVSFVVDGEYVD